MATRDKYISAETVQRYQSYLDRKKAYPSTGPNEMINLWSASFGNGIVMDVKLCNAPTKDGGCWTEAVLFDEGHEVKHPEVENRLLGEWSLEYQGVTYTINLHSK